jgi:hypothetical protein
VASQGEGTGDISGRPSIAKATNDNLINARVQFGIIDDLATPTTKVKSLFFWFNPNFKSVFN